MEASWNFRVKCAVCGEVTDRIVPARQLQRLSSGGFAPLRCTECGAAAATPTVQPWNLSPPDKKLLRSLRINPE